MDIQLNEKYLKDNEDRMKRMAKEELGDEDAKDILIESGMEANVAIDEFSDGELSVTVDSELGCFSFSVPITDEVAFKIIRYMKEKAEKLKRLLDLTKIE